MNRPVLCVDGPSGVGKGELCQALAKKLGWAYLDSGAIYRLSALYLEKKALLAAPAHVQAEALAAMRFHFDLESHPPAIFLNDENVRHALRLESTGESASKLAAQPEIRSALLEIQRHYGGDQTLIADGRDMGTVVFPEAKLKIFLDASAHIRAERRYKQLNTQGESVNLSDLESAIAERDARDRNRPVAPLKPASDAVVIDTTDLSVDAVFAKVFALVQTHFFMN